MLYYENLTKTQLDCIEAGVSGDRLIIAPKGFGKSVIGQTISQELIRDGICTRVLIVAPLKVAQLGWAVEHEKWEHLRPVAVCIGKPEERLDALNSDADIIIVNNENLVWLLKQDHLCDGLIIDETSKYKTPQASGVKAVRRVRKKLNRVIGLSATPALESPLDLYTQIGIVDGFKCLGSRKDRFLQTYFYPTDFKQYNWKPMAGGLERLAQDISSVLYVAEADDYQASLPALNDVVIDVPMPNSAWNAYRSMARDMTFGDIEAVNSAVKAGKLQQIVQGGVYDNDGGYHQIHTAKMTALMDILLSSNTNILVSYQYKFEKEMLIKAGIPIFGDAPQRWNELWNEGVVKVLGVHPKSCGHGICLEAGGYTLVMLSPIWSADQHDQLVGRIHRRGQTHAVTRIVLSTPSTIDEVIAQRVVGKGVAEGLLNEHIKNSISIDNGYTTLE